MPKEEKKPRSIRFTLASLYLVAGLTVWFLVLTKMVPAMNSMVDQQVRGKAAQVGTWNTMVVRLSEWVCAHEAVSMALIAIVGVAGFVLPFVIRPARYLVWVAALAVFLLDVALAGSGYWTMIGGALKDVDDLAR
jgi:hypothetical protein